MKKKKKAKVVEEAVIDEKPVKIRNILYQGEHFECTKEFDQGDDFKYNFPAQDSKFLYRPVVN